PPQIGEIMALLEQVSERWAPSAAETRSWMASQAHDPAVMERLYDTTLPAMQVINAIGRLEPVNGVGLSRATRLPKGSISKITQRLVAQKLVRKKSVPNNKKEVRFQLTPLGRDLAELNRAFDQQMERGFVRFLQRYTSAEMEFVIRLLRDLAQTSFLET